MDGIIPALRRAEKRRLLKRLEKCTDPRLANRIRIVLKLDDGYPVAMIADVLCVSRTTVYRVAGRYRIDGADGLEDRRRGNGTQKIDGAYLSVLVTVVGSCPLDHGWTRPTWTREMLVATLARTTRVRIHVATLSHVLHRIGARRGQPKPVVGCPWPARRKNRRLQQLQDLVNDL
ncbi:helix-turn-helix domain-containing protein, partial [bacterium]|nr:helix-turn-helix domain-containing protein [bacterium]